MVSSSRITDPRRLDVAAFAAAHGELAGAWAQDGFVRLASVAVPGEPQAQPVRWRVAGERAALAGAGVQPALRIEADTVVTLECQRCLGPMQLALHIERRLFFVEGEDAAAALDAESEEDVLALTPSLDVHALIEDELLLSLPIVPRHEICAAPIDLGAGRETLPDDEAREHPFAALAALKRSSRPN